MKGTDYIRTRETEYPDYTAEIDALDKLKDTPEYEENLPKILKRIIDKHEPNRKRTKALYDRYKANDEAVPIFSRKPRFGNSIKPINHKINNDFFSEIVDFFTGYFGTITYSYSQTEESEEETAKKKGVLSKFFKKLVSGEDAVERAAKKLSDFVTRNSMADKDNEVKKIASICGYVGRLLYHDKEGEERVSIVMPFECVALGEDLVEPKYAVRLYKIKDIEDKTVAKAEFYDGDFCYYFEGGSWSALKLVNKKETLFGGLCPLQIIPKNLELLGDAEKVLASIDAYDRTVSDASNEMENFASAILAFKNIKLDKNDMNRLKAEGSIQFNSLGGSDSDLFFVTKDINDTFIEHHLDRLKNDIYRFSKTPNLSDGTFGNESGEARKFRITGIEARCNVFQGKLTSAGVYMFKLLANAWNAQNIPIDPLQCYMEFKRNFPLDIQTEANAIASLIGCGYPKKAAFALASFVDDVDYIMQLIEEEEEQGIASLTKTLPTDYDDLTGSNDTDQDELVSSKQGGISSKKIEE